MGTNQSNEPKVVKCDTISKFVNSLKLIVDADDQRIVLKQMNFSKPIKNLPIVRGIQAVTFIDSFIKNDSILRFNDWCPNVTELAFFRVKFSESVYEEFADSLGSEDQFPAVKTFTFDYKNYMEGLDDFLEAMDKKFPALESLTLFVDVADDLDSFEPMWDTEFSHLPEFFENLKTLSLTCFFDEGDRIFDFIGIHNEKLEELSFTSMLFTKDNQNWTKNCPQLRKLALKCCYITNGKELKHLKGMDKLEELHLSMRKIEWDPKNMIEFIRNIGQGLKVLSIDCERNNKQFKFDDEFKNLFNVLAEERADMVIKVQFGSDEPKRCLEISRGCCSETSPGDLDDDSDDDSEDDDESYYIAEDSSLWADSDDDDDDEDESSTEEEEE
ncbi:uncharacterized protein LOC116342125 [Contarinia nasturtii]|uniref:uncharacterized protein LOC116342125 n=1 Tax=Contarinia nasturtii TaxID=265458 RepID=UPI0012D3AFEA|nr:uncharacterized protein LOC116342125 [Contarinia nasturtii]